MGRTISQEKILGIAEARARDPEAIGPILGEFVVNGNVPVEAMAKILNVSEPTVYRWIFSQASPKDRDKIAKIRKLITILRKAKRARDLPLMGTLKARMAQLPHILEIHRPLTRGPAAE